MPFCGISTKAFFAVGKDFLLSSFSILHSLNYEIDRHLPACVYGCMFIYMRVWE